MGAAEDLAELEAEIENRLIEADVDAMSRRHRIPGPRLGFAAFFEAAWAHAMPDELDLNWHHDLTCYEAERCVFGEKPKLAVCLPPACTKSSILHVFLVAWVWTFAPETSFGFFSYDNALLLRDGERLLKLLQSDWYQKRWGSVLEKEKGNAIGNFVTKAGGRHYTSSILGAAVGWHFDITVVDDTVKPIDVLSAKNPMVAIQRVEGFTMKTLPSRRKSPKTFRQIVTAQRLVKKDWPGRCIEEFGYHPVVLPMRAVQDSMTHPLDIRQPGDLLWPSRHPEETVQELEILLGDDAPAQLQQRPESKGGSWLQKEQIRFVSKRHWPEEGEWFMSVDCAFKDGEQHSRVAIGVWCKAEDGNWYLWHASLKHRDIIATMGAIKSILDKFPQVSKLFIEDKANGTAVITLLRTELEEINEERDQYVDIEEVQTGNESKEARFKVSCVHFRRARVIFPPILSEPWVAEVVTEITEFPMSEFDDAVDMVSQAITATQEETFAEQLKRLSLAA